MTGLHAAGPGVVLGRYPQRRTVQLPSWGGAWMARLLSRRGAGHKLLAKVYAQQNVLKGLTGEIGGVAWDETVSSLRARLAYAGARKGIDDALELEAEALACVAVACERALGVQPYHTQLLAAHIMLRGHFGQLAEMATGEGKTLAVAMAAGAASLAGVPVHVLTANDYLVARDQQALAPFYNVLGLTAGAVLQPMDQAARRAAYACDVTYCTAKELVFDYLRDGVMAPRRGLPEQSAVALSSPSASAAPLLRGLNLAIIDEADSILIDEARVPLILSRAAPDDLQACLIEASRWAETLQQQTHFTVDLEARAARLNATGREALRTFASAGKAHWINNAHREQLVTMALTARHVLKPGREYVVQDGRVHIVDETTGRKAGGRAWSQGLQQLVELSAGCAMSPMLETAAQITYQRFFRRYLRLCGTSGTLSGARGELHKVYGLQVASVPLRLPGQRVRLPSRLYVTTAEQWQAVARRVRELHESGGPVLIGTDTVRASEALSHCLNEHGLAHTVLNALQDEHEAQVVASAGKRGAITVATNMAGRGTDIVLDDASRAAGGLHVICCQQNSARRIDRQLMGRCARQGDAGTYEFVVALDGPLLARHSLARVTKNMFKIKYLRNFFESGIWADVLLWQAQRAAEHRQRRERMMLLQRDERLNDSLAFSGTD